MKKLLWDLFKFLPGLFLLFMVGQLNAAVKPMKAKCQTPRGFHKFSIDNNNVQIIKGLGKDQRLPASSIKLNSRTRYTLKGFKKYFRYDDKNYYIHVEDSKSFSELDDFVVIKNSKGHEMTYPLECGL